MTETTLPPPSSSNTSCFPYSEDHDCDHNTPAVFSIIDSHISSPGRAYEPWTEQMENRDASRPGSDSSPWSPERAAASYETREEVAAGSPHTTPGASSTRRKTRNGSIDSDDVPGTVRIARASFCSSSCTLPDTELHLVIDYREVKLERDAGVAISYTWGEFDRRRKLIGHRIQSAEDKIYLELGEEWDIRGLQKRLVDLSEIHGGIWMDQLCIPQRPEEVKRALERIPDIYRSLDTIALMPGAVCECLLESANTVLDLSDQELTINKVNEVFRPGYGSVKCLNSLGLNSWFDRLWTWQEIMYSKRITVLRTSQTTAHCVKRREDVGHLESFAGLMYQRELEMYQRELDNVSPSDRAYEAISRANDFFLSSGMSLMDAYNFADIVPDNYGVSCKTLCRFLRGDTIENPRWTALREPDVNISVPSFLFNLMLLGSTGRRTTKLRDYVLAVWVDCPRYELPEGYRTMSFPALLENAISQLEGNFLISLATNAPAGLFGDRSAGARWRPTTYLQESDVFDTQTVYGVVSMARAIPFLLQSDGVTLVSRGKNRWSTRTHSAPSRQVFRDSIGMTVFTQFQPVLNQFSGEVLGRLKGAIWERPASLRNALAQEKPSPEQIFKTLLVPPPGFIDRPTLLETTPLYYSDPQTNYHDIVYQVVASALGLPFQACKRAGLELVSRKNPPCVGLFKPVAKPRHLSAGSRLCGWVRSSVTHRHRYATLCVAEHHQKGHFGLQTSGCVLLEAEYVEFGPPAVLEVAGIWVPMKNGWDIVQWIAAGPPDCTNKRTAGILVGHQFSRSVFSAMLATGEFNEARASAQFWLEPSNGRTACRGRN